mgnify:CR=1 FL=1
MGFKLIRYMITYSLPATGNRRHYKIVEARSQSESKQLFESDIPTAKYICSTVMPQSRSL